MLNERDFIKRAKSAITETGNSLSVEEIANFSKTIDLNELFNYRIAVGRRTQETLKSLSPMALKQKPSKGQLKRILDEKAVSENPKAIWLIDFGARKTSQDLFKCQLHVIR